MKFFFTFAFITVFSFMVAAQSPEKTYVSRNKDSLRGIKKVKLVIDYILPGTEKIVEKATVLNLAEKQLQKRGLVVMKEPYPPKSDIIPTVHIVYSLSTFGDDDENLLYQISIEVSQNAILLRDNEIQTPVITWVLGFHGIGTAFNLNPVNRGMLNYLDFLLEDWESVNKTKMENKQRNRVINN